MGLFTRKRKFALPPLDADARDYALSQGAPDLIAECYAEYIAAEDAAGAYGRPDDRCQIEWPAQFEWPGWAARNLAICPQCKSPWALYTPCVGAWECRDCRFCWDEGAA
jgi:hypothetical protein